MQQYHISKVDRYFVVIIVEREIWYFETMGM
jgi:hypothetical protein